MERPPLSSTDHTVVFGILNVTPDSFSDGGQFTDAKTAVEHALRMESEGADVIDVGGESTRPGSEAISEDEEIARVLPVIEKLVRKLKIPISIDTYKPEVAQEALKAGATVINDITALQKPAMAELASDSGCDIVLMHMQGTPKTMQVAPTYGDVVQDVIAYLDARIHTAEKYGIANERIWVDPGFGFGKAFKHNMQLLKRLGEFETLGKPILVGPSRKSFLSRIIDAPATDRPGTTAAAVAVAILNGARGVRVHDVQIMKDVAAVLDALVGTKVRKAVVTPA
jgi:dihydropteroate synthase